VLDALASPVGQLLSLIHTGLVALGLDSAGGWSWGLSIVLLTVTVRLLLFPLFVKQIKSQRRMQQLAPKLKELQKQHKGDRETLNTEMMKLYKENNANPISGCLPLLLQLPVFFALFTVIRNFKTDAEASFGLSAQQLQEGAVAKILGAPISAAFNSPAAVLDDLGAEALTVRLVAFVMVVGMGASTFWTQRQLMARAGTTDPQQVMVQKLLLYVLPLSFAVSGVFFPIGVLLYWLTTNVLGLAPRGAPRPRRGARRRVVSRGRACPTRAGRRRRRPRPSPRWSGSPAGRCRLCAPAAAARPQGRVRRRSCTAAAAR
jgi:YidC/Oxa1 family membrane protein insertase